MPPCMHHAKLLGDICSNICVAFSIKGSHEASQCAELQNSSCSCENRNQSRPCNGMDLSSGAPLPSGSQPPHHTTTKPGSLCNKVNRSFSRRSLQQSSLLFEWLVFPLRAIMHITQDTFIRRKECFSHLGHHAFHSRRCAPGYQQHV